MCVQTGNSHEAELCAFSYQCIGSIPGRRGPHWTIVIMWGRDGSPEKDPNLVCTKVVVEHEMKSAAGWKRSDKRMSKWEFWHRVWLFTLLGSCELSKYFSENLMTLKAFKKLVNVKKTYFNIKSKSVLVLVDFFLSECHIIDEFAHKRTNVPVIPFSYEMLLSFICESHKIISKSSHQINVVENQKGKISPRICGIFSGFFFIFNGTSFDF